MKTFKQFIKEMPGVPGDEDMGIIQGLAGANAGVQSAFANQMSAQQTATQMQMQNMQMLTNMGTQLYLGQ